MILQPVSAGGFGALAQRWGIELAGSKDAANRTFLLPEPAAYNPPYMDVRVHHNGRRLPPLEYRVEESVPGLGYDTVKLIFAPTAKSDLRADYTVSA